MSSSPAEPAVSAPIDEHRFKALAEELRCLVCQNQSLADSQAGLADDLRDEVREQMASGRSDAEIKDYLVARYGDFVLFKPPLKQSTWALWAGPFALLATGGGVWWAIQRRQRLNRNPQVAAGPADAAGGAIDEQRDMSAADSESARAKARRLLD